MTIKRYTTYFTSIVPDPNGQYVEWEDYDREMTEMEYECRFLKESLEIEQDEVSYWKDKYFELYEQSY